MAGWPESPLGAILAEVHHHLGGVLGTERPPFAGLGRHLQVRAEFVVTVGLARVRAIGSLARPSTREDSA